MLLSLLIFGSCLLNQISLFLNKSLEPKSWGNRAVNLCRWTRSPWITQISVRNLDYAGQQFRLLVSKWTPWERNRRDNFPCR
jgi:hypothetical protein